MRTNSRRGLNEPVLVHEESHAFGPHLALDGAAGAELGWSVLVSGIVHDWDERRSAVHTAQHGTAQHTPDSVRENKGSVVGRLMPKEEVVPLSEQCKASYHSRLCPPVDMSLRSCQVLATYPLGTFT